MTVVPAAMKANGGATSPAPADATGSCPSVECAPHAEPARAATAVSGKPCDTARVLQFTVPGIPTPWARTGGGKTVARFTPAKQGSAAGAIKLLCSHAMRGASPFEGPVRLTVTAIYPWPKSWSPKKRSVRRFWKTSRPDVDNLGKIVADALNGVAWIDDAQIALMSVAKRYHEIPALHVHVELLT